MAQPRKPSKVEKHVLIVDDDEDYRATLRELVNAELRFVRVSEADTAEAALALVTAEPVDLVLVDYRLPHLDGIAFLIAARKIVPDAQFVMLTAEPDQYLLSKADCTVLTKPVQAEVLTKIVRKLLSPPKNVR